LSAEEIADIVPLQERGRRGRKVKIQVDTEKEDYYYNTFLDKSKTNHVWSSKLSNVFEAMVEHFRSGPDFAEEPDYVKEFSVRELQEAHGHSYSIFLRQRENQQHWSEWRTDFEDESLTEAVFDHGDTKNFVESIKKMIGIIIKEQDGDLDNSMGTVTKKLVSRARELMKVDRPSFDSILDTVWGLKMLINDTWAFRVELKNMTVNKSERHYSGRFSFTVYDHFGLDDDDVKKFGHLSYFSSWYILQRYNGGFKYKYKPFVTRCTKEFDISGNY